MATSLAVYTILSLSQRMLVGSAIPQFQTQNRSSGAELDSFTLNFIQQRARALATAFSLISQLHPCYNQKLWSEFFELNLIES